MSGNFPELQKLLKLRGQDGPVDGYFEEFLEEFHRRQRQDLMKRSARSLFLERLSVWFREMGSAKWAYGAGVAYAGLMVLFFAWPRGEGVGDGLEPASFEQSVAPMEEKVLQFDPAEKHDRSPAQSMEF